MKRLSALILSFAAILLCPFAAFAAEGGSSAQTEPSTVQQTEAGDEIQQSEPQQDASQPRLMVTSYKLSANSVTPDKSAKLTVSFKNYSKTKDVSNIKLSVSDESGEIKVGGMGTAYVEKIKAGGVYSWQLEVTASKTAAIGEHKLTVAAEYEDKYYTAYSSSDVISVNVRQSVSLDYDGIVLPSGIVQGDTASMDVTLMNTGKSTLRNCRLEFKIDSIESGGTLFIGEIPAGESKNASANLRAAADKLGDVSGTVTLLYEDEFGDSYNEEISVSTVINEKKEVEPQEEDEQQTKYPLWWLFLIVGAAAGAGAGAGVVVIIHSNKQRKEDEKLL